jgi:6-pyruvoyltetrahydropterin/6-carboxytetrahydropterin synthase
LYETPNCFTDCYKDSISDAERKNFWDYRGEEVAKYRDDKGVVEYDDRKV